LSGIGLFARVYKTLLTVLGLNVFICVQRCSKLVKKVRSWHASF